MFRTIQSTAKLLRRPTLHGSGRFNGLCIDRSAGLSTVAGADDASDRLLVVGSGVGGSATALIAAELYQIPVTMLYAGATPVDCNSFWAQGGIIYRNYNPDSGDSAESLARDIHRAGAGLCDPQAVEKVSTEGPDRVRQLLLDLENKGVFANVPFDRADDGELSLCLEASHEAPRILFYADRTGQAITEHITRAAARHPLITMQPQTLVTDLVVRNGTCVGVETLKMDSSGQTIEKGQEYAARGTVLASGGFAGIYQHSTNPAGFNALGSSVAVALRAGVTCQDLEYVQFHPTALCIPNEARFLLTEALRGEGAILRDASGRAFARDFHEDGELAPRDVVARGVFNESQKGTGEEHNVFLDITHRDADWLRNRFPAIQGHLTPRGLDLATDRLPITPAAHYTCGGVKTDLNGLTSLPGLYAAGEAARTGLHGGNRLASTSLLEALVYGASVADFVGGEIGKDVYNAAQVELEAESGKGASSSAVLPTPTGTAERAKHLLTDLRKIMWDQVGIMRTPSGLTAAAEKLSAVREEADMLHLDTPSKETSSVRDAAYTGQAVAEAALQNRVSKGTHYIMLDEEGEDEQVTIVG